MCMKNDRNSTRSRFMATASGESPEKLEDMIVRAAESTAAHAQAAKAAIGAVIFGQEKVVEQLLSADANTRASPRTQSALLQAMQEQHVTGAGVRHDLPKPFHVLAP